MGYIFVQRYLTADGRVWEMCISRGVVYCRWQGSTDWKVTDQDYLGQRWMLRPSREWVVVPKLRSDSIAYAFYHLATVLLPFWENYVHSQFNRSTRKQWSYDGVMALGDLGNRVYALVVNLAQLLRERLGHGCTEHDAQSHVPLKRGFSVLNSWKWRRLQWKQR